MPDTVAPSSHPDDAIFLQAEEWSEKRKPITLIHELFVRLVQLAIVSLNVCQSLGLDTTGLPREQASPAAPPGTAGPDSEKTERHDPVM